MLYHKSHLCDLPSASQITHVQSPVSAFKSERSIFSPEIITGPGGSCSNTHPQPFPPSLPAEQSWQRRGGRNAAGGGARGCKACARHLPPKTAALCARGGGRTWRGKHPPGISHGTQPSPQARSQQGQTLLLQGDGDSAVPSLGACRQPPGCSAGASGGCPGQHPDPRCRLSPGYGEGSSSGQGAAPAPAARPERAALHQPDARPPASTFSGGMSPAWVTAEATGRGGGDAGRAGTRRAGSPAPSCLRLSHRRTQHPRTEIRSAALSDEDKGPKRRPPPPRWLGRRMSNDISQS